MQTINISFLLPILDMQVDCISAVLSLSRARRQLWLMEEGGNAIYTSLADLASRPFVRFPKCFFFFFVSWLERKCLVEDDESRLSC